MRLPKVFLLLIALFQVLLTACTLEQESIDNKINTPLKEDDSLTSLQLAFKENIEKCLLGDFSKINEITDAYFSSLELKDISNELAPLLDSSKVGTLKNYLFQEQLLNESYNTCIHKYRATGHDEYLNYFITKPVAMARIANYFYANDDYANGNFWSQKVIDMSGKSRGYYTLGRIFIENKKNTSMGAQLLSEASKLGNSQAKQLLTDKVLNTSVFDVYLKRSKKTN